MNTEIEVFIEMTLTDLKTATVIQCRGLQLLKIINHSKLAGDALRVAIIELVLIDGKPIKEKYLDDLYPEDIMSLATAIGEMIGQNPLIKQFKTP